MNASSTSEDMSIPNDSLGEIDTSSTFWYDIISDDNRYFSKPFHAIMTPLSVQYFGAGATRRQLNTSQTLNSLRNIVCVRSLWF